MSRNSPNTVVDSTPDVLTDTLPPWDFDAGIPTLGFEAAAWTERWLIQPNGPDAGKPFRLTRRQLTFLLWFYALDRKDGLWLYNHAARRQAKGSGKSPFAAVWALIEFCAPVRLERFDDRQPGGVRGRTVSMPWVQIAATAESQTANTMRMVRAFAPKGSAVAVEHGLDVGKTRYYRLPEGTLEVITSSATAAEGAEVSAVVGDETEWWLPANGGPALMSVLADNLAKSGARMMETSNSWVPGRNSVAEATWDDWVSQQAGRQQGTQRVLYDARMAPADTNMADPLSLRAGLEFVYDDCDWKRDSRGRLDVQPIMERIYRQSAKIDDSKRKYLNWPTAALDAWMIPEKYHRLARPDITIAAKDRIVLFFDGSKSRDATALVGCRVDDGHVFTLGVWQPDPQDDEATVDVAEVDRAVMLAFEQHTVAAFFADVREWESYALSEWPRRYADDLEIMAVPHGRPPQSIAWDMRSHSYEFARAAEAAEAEILDGAFTHDGDLSTMEHVTNCRRRYMRDLITVGKESPDSSKKIDAAVCMIGARMVRRMVLAQAPKKSRSGVVW